MADSKISALTAVTTPASTDEFAVNQGGTSKKMTRAQVHALETGEHFVLPSQNDATTPSLAFGDGDTGFFELSDDTLDVSIGGISRFRITSAGITALSAGPSFIRETPSGTNPTLRPDGGDGNTGIGHVAADNVSLVCGGLEAVRAEDPADLAATETSLWVYDDDNAAIQQVTVGAADSGGTGFKVLRIPN